MRRAPLGLLILLLAAGPRPAAGPFTPADLKTIQSADGMIVTLSCYFGDKAKGCPPSSNEAPQWLREDLPAMRERDCQQGTTTESRAWAASIGDIGYFLYQARSSQPAAKAKAPPPSPLPVLKQIRDGFKRRIDMMEARQFSRSLRGRGGDFLGRFRFILGKMNDAVTGLEKAENKKFRDATLSIAWQVDELKRLFHSEPGNPYAESGPPDCSGLESYEGRALAPSKEEVGRLRKMGLNYRANNDFAKAGRSFDLALPMAETLGDVEAQEDLHRLLAEVWMRQGRSEQALPHMDRSLALARSRSDLVSERDLLTGFAALLKEVGGENELRASYEDQADKAQRRIETALEGYKRGERFYSLGRYAEAKREYLDTGMLGHALSYVQIALCEIKLGNVEAAVAADLEALKLARLQDKKIPEARALQSLSAIYLDQGNASAAMESIETLVRLGLTRDVDQLPADLRLQLDGKRTGHFRALENLYNLSDRFDRAQQRFEEFRSLAKARGLPDHALRAWVHLARAYVGAAEPEKAAESFSEAIRSVGAAEGVQLETLEFLDRSLFSIQPYWNREITGFAGSFRRTIAGWKLANSRALQARVAAARNRKDKIGELEAQYALAVDWESQANSQLGRSVEDGSYEATSAERAITEYERALDLATRLRRADFQVAARRGVARMHGARLEWDLSTDSLERALTTELWRDGRNLQEADPNFKALDSAVALKLGDPETVGDVLRELGYSYLGQGVPITAIAFVRRSMDVHPSELSRLRTLSEFARLLNAGGYPEHSVSFLERLLSEGKVEGAPRLKAAVLINLATAQRGSGGLGEDFALQRLEQAYNLLSPRGLNVKDLPLLLMLGELRLKKGNPAGAADAYETAIAVSDQYRAALADESARAALLAGDPGSAQNYQAAVGGMLSVAAADPAFLERAFTAAEKSRTRALLDSLRGAELEREGPLRKEETSLNQRLAMLAQKGLDEGWNPEDTVAFNSLQDRLARLADEIRRQDPQYASLRYSRPASLSELAQVLKPGEAFLSFKFAGRESSMWAFLMQGGKAPALYRLDAAAALKAVRELPPLPPKRPTEVWAAVPERLGKYLWAPFDADLAGAKKVFIVPDGELWTVPWPAVEAGGKLLVDKEYTLQVLPSGSALADIRRAVRPKADYELAAFAPIKELPGAQSLLETLRWMYPGAKTYAAIEASREAAVEKSAKNAYVVLYTKGIVDERNPWLSALLFSDTQGKPAPLTVTEMMRMMKLDSADLVVLAGCETAKGQFARGQGLMGLTRGFFYAGARGVIATGWTVTAESTADVIKGTFQGIHLGLDPAKALQMAQRDVRKRKYDKNSGEHPFYWAGFQIYGDPQ